MIGDDVRGHPSKRSRCPPHTVTHIHSRGRYALTIRSRHPATDDAVILRLIRRRLLPLNAPSLRRKWTDRELKHRLKQGTTKVWTPAAAPRSRPGAFITFFIRDAELFVDMLAVDAPYQRSGIGSRLLRLAEAWGVSRGCRVMRLFVNDDNRAGIRFYMKHGMMPAWYDERVRSYIMEKRIG